MPSNANAQRPSAVLDDEVRAAVAARQELGEELEPEVIAAFLARIEARMAGATAQPPDTTADTSLGFRRRLTQRLAWSLGLGIPLVAVAGGVPSVITGEAGFASFVGTAAALLTVLILNIYTTEVDKEMELTRLRRR